MRGFSRRVTIQDCQSLRLGVFSISLIISFELQPLIIAIYPCGVDCDFRPEPAGHGPLVELAGLLTGT
jgi:hypothetical protein